MVEKKTGLEGVVAGDTAVCLVDEINCELLYRGYSVEELAKKSTFEETAYLLLYGELPNKTELTSFNSFMADRRELPKEVTEVLHWLPPSTDPMDALKVAVGVLEATEPKSESNLHEDNIRKATSLIARIPVIIATQYHISQGTTPVPPRKDLSLAANLLYLLRGKEAEEYEFHILDKSLILYAEHEFNASTFAARITASTLLDLHSAVITAIGTLKGPLHGGANERAMEMILEIGTPDKAEKYIYEAIKMKKKIMGFGHRVYKKGDPRNPFIKSYSKELSQKKGESKWFEISEKVEKIIYKEKGLHPNLDFYASSAYYLLGIPIPLYTPLFAASRVSGWAAHIMEQHEHNRLIRPRSEYTGSSKRTYVPLPKR